MHALEAENASFKREMQRLDTEKVAVSTVEIQELRAKLGAALAPVEQLSKQVIAIGGQLDTSRLAESASRKTIVELREQLLVRGKEMLAHQQRTLKSESDASSEIKKLAFRNSSLETELERFSAQVDDLKVEVIENKREAKTRVSQAVKLEEEARVMYGELRKLRSMCKNLNSKRDSHDMLEVEARRLQNELTHVIEQAEADKEAAQLLDKERQTTIAELQLALKESDTKATVQQDEIQQLRGELHEKEHVIEQLATINAAMERQQRQLEILLEQREILLVNSASDAVAELRTNLANVTHDRDDAIKERDQHLTTIKDMEYIASKKEEIVAKAASTNASYGRHIKELQKEVRSQKASVSEAKRMASLSQQELEQARNLMVRQEAQHLNHVENSVDKQDHEIVCMKLTEAERMVNDAREETHKGKLDATAKHGRDQGTIKRLDELVVRLQREAEEQHQERSKADAKGGNAREQLTSQIVSLSARVGELTTALAVQREDATQAREQQKRAAHVLTAAEEEVKGQKHAVQRAQESETTAQTECRAVRRNHEQLLRDKSVSEERMGADIKCSHEQLNMAKQQQAMLVKLLGALRKEHSKGRSQPTQEEVKDYAEYLGIDIGADRDLNGPSTPLLFSRPPSDSFPIPGAPGMCLSAPSPRCGGARGNHASLLRKEHLFSTRPPRSFFFLLQAVTCSGSRRRPSWRRCPRVGPSTRMSAWTCTTTTTPRAKATTRTRWTATFGGWCTCSRCATRTRRSRSPRRCPRRRGCRRPSAPSASRWGACWPRACPAA